MPFDPTPRQLTEFGQLFLDAADLIEKNGLNKFLRRSTQGGNELCMLGALYEAQCRDAWANDNPLTARWAEALGFKGDGGVGGLICQWNNLPERQKEEVAARFRQYAYVA